MKRILFFVFALSALFLANCGDDTDGTSEESVSSTLETSELSGDLKQGDAVESRDDTTQEKGADCCSGR